MFINVWEHLVYATNKMQRQYTLAKALLLTNVLFLAPCGVNYFDAEGMQLLAPLTEWELRQICCTKWLEHTNPSWGSLHHGLYLQQNEAVCKEWIDLGEARSFDNLLISKSQGAFLICLFALAMWKDHVLELRKLLNIMKSG